MSVCQNISMGDCVIEYSAGGAPLWAFIGLILVLVFIYLASRCEEEGSHNLEYHERNNNDKNKKD